MRRNAGTDAGASHTYTDGDPGNSIPASVLNADWLNIMQEEMAGAVEAAGLTVDQSNAFATNNLTQLTAAIKALARKMSGYDAVCGSGTYCTHATLEAALADAAVVAGMKILVQDSETVSTNISIAKANLQIDFKPGVVFTKGGSATTALSITSAGTGLRLNGGRFVGFTTGITIAVSADYCIFLGQRFSTNTADFSDSATTTTILGNVTE